MKKQHCLRWAKALINGKHGKRRGEMSDSSGGEKPTAMCCLGVLNETFKPMGYKCDRIDIEPKACVKSKIITTGRVYGVLLSDINDGGIMAQREGVSSSGLTHEQIGLLLLFAIESGEYRNI